MHINIYRAFGFLLVLLRIVGGVFIVSFFSELATIFLLLSLDFGSSMDFETSSIFFPLLLTLRVPLRISLDSVFSLLLEATFLLRACLLVGVSKILQTSLVSSNFLFPLLDLVALISFLSTFAVVTAVSTSTFVFLVVLFTVAGLLLLTSITSLLLISFTLEVSRSFASTGGTLLLNWSDVVTLLSTTAFLFLVTLVLVRGFFTTSEFSIILFMSLFSFFKVIILLFLFSSLTSNSGFKFLLLLVTLLATALTFSGFSTLSISVLESSLTIFSFKLCSTTEELVLSGVILFFGAFLFLVVFLTTFGISLVILAFLPLRFFSTGSSKNWLSFLLIFSLFVESSKVTESCWLLFLLSSVALSPLLPLVILAILTTGFLVFLDFLLGGNGEENNSESKFSTAS